MKLSELQTLSSDQLKEQLISLKKSAMNLRFQKVTGQLERTSEIRKGRRTIARIKTLLAQRAATVRS